jgi:DNA mismatch repair protein MutL
VAIRLLPPDLANQIAAGEVVERPASIVKELVENALDAGARRIAIAIELGGKAFIRVEDDGVGMSAEDARLAVERHATSKIATSADLAAIRTLGFRGEALPSIASVSHFVLRTRARGASGGVEIAAEGGAVGSAIGGPRAIGAPEGTTIEVRDLFYNLPARRKFLKSDSAESAQVSRIVTQFALAYPEVGFTLTSGGRRVLQCPPVAAPPDRFFQIYGERPDLTPLRKEAAGIRLTGYIAALAEQGPVRGPQNIFVNRRIVRDKTIAHAITYAYRTATIKERSPEVHLFIELAPERVDVNVHPTKAEVRFLEQSLIHEVLRRGLMDALGQSHPPELQLRGAAPSSVPAGFGSGTQAGGGAQARGGESGVSVESGVAAMIGPGGLSPWELASTASPAGGPATRPALPGVFNDPLSVRSTTTAPAEPATLALQSGMVLAPEGTFRRQTTIDPDHPLVPLGQFRDTYIVAIDTDGLCIIDQHVAHERVLFEQILDRLTSGPLESQRLLEPVLIELSAGQRQALMLHEADLTRFGFDLVEFGGGGLRIASVPALLRFEEAAAAVKALAEDLEGLDRGGRVEEALRRIAATMACHAAVKANDPLTFEKMQYLLSELRRTAYSTVCPHGRPVVLRLPRREIERNFQRS